MASCGRDSLLSLVLLLLFCATWSLYLLTLRLHNPASPPITTATISSLVHNALHRTTSTPYRVLVTGGSGFIGSHVVDRLLLQGHFVTVVDNLESSQSSNLLHWLHHPRLTVMRHDIVEPLDIEVDMIYHLAATTSMTQHRVNPIKTIKTTVLGTHHMLGLARRIKARILFASSGDIYGTQRVLGQRLVSEDEWGAVNPSDADASYAQSKRVAETYMYMYARNGVDVRVARVFATIGPRLAHSAPPYYGPLRTSSYINRVIQLALRNESIVMYSNDASVLVSLQYVDDVVTGLLRLMHSNYSQPVNLANPQFYTLEMVVRKAIELSQSSSKIKYTQAVKHSINGTRVYEAIPRLLRAVLPDTHTADHVIGWSNCHTKLRRTLLKMIDYHRRSNEDKIKI